MQEMQWVITKDFINSDDAVTRDKEVGRGTYPFDKRSNLPHHFRLLDDDGEVYFQGKCDFDCHDESDGFAPLDDFGITYGCTTIQYLDVKGWMFL